MKEQLTNCLNCGNTITSNFCDFCGQKTTTKRFNISQLISNDFLISVFNLEKGFLFTLKSLFTRPGHFIREYIKGKRKTYFHFLTFLLIVIALSVFISEFSTVSLADLMGGSENAKRGMKLIENFAQKNPRLATLLQIPIYALMSFLWFLKSQQNFAEHLILNTYKASGELLIATFFTIITIFYTNVSVLFYIYNVFIYGLIILFGALVFYQYFKPYYNNKMKFIMRIIACIISTQLLAGTLLGIIAVIQAIIDGSFENFNK